MISALSKLIPSSCADGAGPDSVSPSSQRRKVSKYGIFPSSSLEAKETLDFLLSVIFNYLDKHALESKILYRHTSDE